MKCVACEGQPCTNEAVPGLAWCMEHASLYYPGTLGEQVHKLIQDALESCGAELVYPGGSDANDCLSYLAGYISAGASSYLDYFPKGHK